MNWIIIICCYISLFALGLADNVRGPLLPEFLDFFNISDSLGSSIFALSSFFAFLGAYNSSRVIKYMSHAKLLKLSGFLLGVSLFAMSVADHFLVFLGTCIFFGISLGLLGVAQNFLVSVSVEDRFKNQVLSGLHSMYGLSSFFSPLVVALVAQKQWHWSVSLQIVGALCLIIASFVSFAKIPDFRQNLSSEGQLDNDLLAKKMNPYHWMGAAMLASYVMAEILISSRLALYVRRSFAMDLEQSSLMVTYFFTGLLAGRLFCTFVKLRFSLWTQMMGSLFLSFIALIGGLTWSPNLLVVSGLTMAPFYPLAVSVISQSFPRTLSQAISKSMAAQSGFVVAMHLSVGVLTDYLGIAWAMVFGLLALAMSLVFLILLRNAQKTKNLQ